LVPVPRHAVERFGSAWTEPGNLVSNGPFRLQEWIPGEKVILTRNPDYFGTFRGNLSQVELIDEIPPLEQLAAYNANRVDLLNLEPETMQARYRFGEQYIQQENSGTLFLGFGPGESCFQNRWLRKALALAIDKGQIVNKCASGLYLPPSGGFLPHGFPGYSPGIGLPFNPEKARQLFAEAGYPDGKGLPLINLVTHNNRRFEKIALSLKQVWEQELGIRVRVTVMSSGEFMNNMQRSQLFLAGWIADYPDPDNFLRVAVRKYARTWRHAEYVRLINRAARITDPIERLNLYRQADQILMEEAAIVPLGYRIQHRLVKPWVRNFDNERTPMIDVIIEPH
jgi:oligopeptide transport system substrate-binding protein